MLIQRHLYDGHKIINLTFAAIGDAPRFMMLLDQMATAIGHDVPFEDTQHLLTWRDALHARMRGKAPDIIDVVSFGAGKNYYSLSILEIIAQRFQFMCGVFAQKVGNDNPFGDMGTLLNFRDAIDHARWGDKAQFDLGKIK